MYTIRVYSEKQLDRSIRGLVKSTYYDYTINEVKEIEQYDIEGTVYLFLLEGEDDWKTVRLGNGDMDVMETLHKERAGRPLLDILLS